MQFGWLVESGVTSNSVIYVKDLVTVLYETLSLGRANPTNDIAFIYSKSFFKKPVLK